MDIYQFEKIKQKLVKLCQLNNCNDTNTIQICFKIINKYLSYEGSSVSTVINCLDIAINNNAWVLAWNLLREETDRLSGKFYIEEEKKQLEYERELVNYIPINLGDSIFDEIKLQKLKIGAGVIDAFGVYHTSEREGYRFIDHRELATYLKEKDKIFTYYIRVCPVQGHKDIRLCAESILYGDLDSLKDFLLTEKMAIALYNSIMSKTDVRFTTFEEKLAFYGTEFGYYSTQYSSDNQIYNYELYNKNMKVLSDTLGKRFDKSYLTSILKHNNDK